MDTVLHSYGTPNYHRIVSQSTRMVSRKEVLSKYSNWDLRRCLAIAFLPSRTRKISFEQRVMGQYERPTYPTYG
ncbi:hypothetical protein ACLOJK_037024 [Asimina triloba]